MKPREGRVGLIPAACVELVRGGHEVFVEHSAGERVVILISSIATSA